MNKTILIGNLTKDVELSTTSNGISVAKFTLAVNRKYMNENGERECDFINCIAWRTQAENLGKYCKKGDKIAIVGAIQTRNYEAQDGSKRFVTEVVAEEIEFLGKKESGVEEKPKEETKAVMTPIDDKDLPF